MRVLQIGIKPPLPSNDGGAIAIRSMAEGLIAQGHEVYTITLETEKHPLVISEDDQALAEAIHLETHRAQTFPSAWKTVVSSFTNPGYITSRFDLPSFHQLISKRIDEIEPDVLLIESIFAMPYATHAKANMKIWYRAHNLEFKLWQDRLNSTSIARRFVLAPLVKHLESFEKQLLKQAHSILAVSDDLSRLLQRFAPKAQILTVPIAISEPKHTWTPPKKFRLRYLGALDWQPNIDGLTWFCNKVLPAIAHKNPDIRLEIAGRNPYAEVLNLVSPNVSVIGEVENASEFISGGSLLISPLLSGSGVRVKIIEALSAGVPFVATHVAVSGLDIQNNVHGFVTDHAGQMANTIVDCMNNDHLLREISENQRNLYKAKYSPSAVLTEPLSELT